MSESANELENVLRDFTRAASRLPAEHGCEVWRFAWNGRHYRLYFYPRMRGGGTRLFRGNPAQRHFFGLQMLQRHGIASPRPVAHLSGFRIDARVGDAVVVHDAGTSLRSALGGEIGGPAPNRRAIVQQVGDILHRLGEAHLGHTRLSLDSFCIDEGTVRLWDAANVRRGGLRMKQLFRLGHDAARIASRTEIRRAWNLVQPGASMPKVNPVSARLWSAEFRTQLRSMGALAIGRWRGVYTCRSRFARAGSPASRLQIAHADWERAWPELLQRLESGEFTRLKHDASGEIVMGEVVIAGRSIPVVIKRPRNKFWYRYVLDVFRPSRARRMWVKTWKTIVRGFPTEWPMLLMERRVMGYVTDALVVFERVEGPTLAEVNLDALPPVDRDTLFRRAGRSLRLLEQRGLQHMDAKSTNWVVAPDVHGPLPVMIDLFGIRTMIFTRVTWGVRRLLRAMREHPQYTPADSLALCSGYAPFSPIDDPATQSPKGANDPA